MIRSACLILAIGAALHAQAVQTKLSFSKSSYGRTDPVTMAFQVQNTGSTSVSFCTWNTPLGRIGGDVLDVSGAAGKARYVGFLIKRGPLTANDYIVLAPGQSISKTIDLSKYYDLSAPGSFSVKFAPNGAQGLSSKMAAPLDVGQPSAPASFTAPTGIAPAPSAAPATTSAKGANTPTCGNCSSAYNATLATAYAAAVSMSSNAVDSLVESPISLRVNAARSRAFFGAYDFERYRSAANVLENVHRALRDENVTFTDVSTNTSHQCHADFACVQAGTPYQVFLGQYFWTAPLTGEDSKAGTLIHELSHFTVLGGTSDHPTAANPLGTYGIANCQAMAINSPADAVQHADCMEYYSENPTSLTQGTDQKVRGDLNDDGKADLAYFETGNNSFYVSTSTGANFTWGGQWTAPNSFGGNKDQFYIGDFNGDGLPDLAYFETGNNTMYVATNTGAGFGGPGSGVWVPAGTFGGSTGRFLVGDFNGDGRSDLAYFDPSNNQVVVSTSTGTSFNGPRSGVWVPTNWFGWQASHYFVGDFDGDRIADLGYQENDNTFHVNLSTGTGFFGTGSGRWVEPNQYGGTWGKYLIGDFDGDGKSDLGYFEPGTNTFYVATSTGSGFLGSRSGVWANSGAIGTDMNRFYVGDFNGDGLDDVAYQQTSNNSILVALTEGWRNAFGTANVWVSPNSFGGSWGKYFIGQSR